MPIASPVARVVSSLLLPGWLAILFACTASASVYEYLPVGDPLEAELRTLDILGPPAGFARLRIPRLGMRPLQRLELDSLPAAGAVPTLAHRISLERIHRTLAREHDLPPKGVRGHTPRLYQTSRRDDARFEVSTGFEGSAELGESSPRIASGTGLHARAALESERWLAFTHIILGEVEGAQRFADPLIRESELILHTEETYLGYTGAGNRWGMQFGRGRWHWGPGEEASLLLSKTAAPLTGLAFHARLEALRADGTALSVTMREAAGEQLAAHRLEWQPADGLRLGLSEAARYRSAAWKPLYLVGVLPYILVQRLLNQEEPDSSAAHRNNIMIGVDVSWRAAPGTRLYAEWLTDDTGGEGLPKKYAYQLGAEGAGTLRGTRATWGVELTRVTRFVYSSFFGRDYIAQDRPLGFPFAPDARRLRVRAAWDLSADWQVLAVATRTERGENELGVPYVPGSAPVTADRFEGVVEKTRELEGGLRWWPAAGVDLSTRVGHRWVDEAGHVAGARTRGAYLTLAVRLVR